jgi:acyl-CoA thioester hydrolase
MVHEALSGFPVVFSIPAQWGEQDPFGHINNIVYLRWCETARIQYLGRIGLNGLMKEQGIGPIVANISCNFRSPVVYPDTVHIGARVTKIGRTSFTMEHVLVSDKLGVVADASSVLVVYDYGAGKPHPVPEKVRRAIAEIEGGERG